MQFEKSLKKAILSRGALLERKCQVFFFIFSLHGQFSLLSAALRSCPNFFIRIQHEMKYALRECRKRTYTHGTSVQNVIIFLEGKHRRVVNRRTLRQFERLSATLTFLVCFVKFESFHG